MRDKPAGGEGQPAVLGQVGGDRREAHNDDCGRGSDEQRCASSQPKSDRGWAVGSRAGGKSVPTLEIAGAAPGARTVFSFQGHVV